MIEREKGGVEGGCVNPGGTETRDASTRGDPASRREKEVSLEAMGGVTAMMCWGLKCLRVFTKREERN